MRRPFASLAALQLSFDLPGGLLHRAAACLLLLLATLVTLKAQDRGSVSGTITDPSNAGVPDVIVTITDQRTNVVRTASTNGSGAYTFGDLIPDSYSLTAEAKGFKRAERSAFTLDVAQAARIDLQLQIGDVSQSVSVNDVPPLLATNDATVGQVIGPVMMSQLPLNDRNYLQLALLSPGTGTYGKSTFYNSALTDNAGSVISGSAGEDRNAFSLDGADIKSYLINGSFVPSIEAVQEFKIETTPYSAELGTSPGAQILLITKNGTNQIHGSAYEFVRNDYFDAKNYFDNPDLRIPELRKNQFGATIGGPIIKNRLFYFGDYEGNIQRIGQTFFGTVPTLLQRGGRLLRDRAEYLQPVVDRALRVLLKRIFENAIREQQRSRQPDQQRQCGVLTAVLSATDERGAGQQLLGERRGPCGP